MKSRAGVIVLALLKGLVVVNPCLKTLETMENEKYLRRPE